MVFAFHFLGMVFAVLPSFCRPIFVFGSSQMKQNDDNVAKGACFACETCGQAQLDVRRCTERIQQLEARFRFQSHAMSCNDPNF